MKKYILFLILNATILASSQSYSYWYYNSYKGPTFASVCEQLAQTSAVANHNQYHTNHTYLRSAPTNPTTGGSCVFQYLNSAASPPIYDDELYSRYYIRLVADQCLGQDEIYDPVSKNCITPVCPSVGTTLKTTTCTDVPEINICAGGTCQLTNKDGCGFDSPMSSASSYVASDGQFCVTYTGTANGNNLSVPPSTPGITQYNDAEQPAPKPIQQDQTFNSTVDNQTNTDASGTTTDIETTTETVKKPDTVIDTSSEYIYQDGQKIEKITTTTTVTNPDGSKTVTKAVSYNQTTGKKIDWDKTSGQVTVTDPVVETSGTTTTETYNSSGKITSSASVGTNGAGTSNGSISGGNNGTTGDKTGGADGKEGTGDDDNPEETCNNCSFNGQGPKDGGYYTPTDKTYDSVITAFKDKVNGTGAIAAAQNFFTISLPSGACPVWSAQIPYINFNLVIDQQCSPVMTSIWPYIQGVLLVVASFVAFRWAFL